MSSENPLGIYHWTATDWRHFLILSSILLLYPLMNGYPFLFPDAWTYAAGNCVSEYRSPVLGCAMKPAVLIGGVWGYISIQVAVAAYILILFSKQMLGSANLHVLIPVMIISSLGLFTGWLMADVWLLFALLALFIMLTAQRSVYLLLLFTFSISVHLGNFPVIMITIILYIIVVKTNIRAIITSFICIAAAVSLVVTTNLLNQEFHFSSKWTYTFLSSRIIHDMPEVLESRCKQDPGFELCEMKSTIYRISRSRPDQLIWHEEAPRNIKAIGPLKYEALSRDLILSSIFPFFNEHISTALNNMSKQFVNFHYTEDFAAHGDETWSVQGMLQYYPEDFSTYKRSWQATNTLTNIYDGLEEYILFFYLLSVLICLGYGVAKWKHRNNKLLVKLSIFTVIVLLVNAMVMSNLAGSYGRYLTRISFLPFFTAILIILQCNMIVNYANFLRNRIKILVLEK